MRAPRRCAAYRAALDRLVVLWYRGGATPEEKEQLVAERYLCVTSKYYGHLAATPLGQRRALRAEAVARR